MPDANQLAVGFPKPLLAVFWSTVVLFAVVISLVFGQQLFPNPRAIVLYGFLPGVAVLAILGVVLVVMARAARIRRGLKISFVLTGISAVGIPVAAFLHNAVYALMIYAFGPEFWASGDEALFFGLALFVFPALLLVGAITGAVSLAKARREEVA